MTISDATRAQRVKRWTDQKGKWESKLENAKNPNDTDTAKTMIAEAESALDRLGVVREEKRAQPLKQKAKVKDQPKTSIIAKDNTGTIGL